MKVLTISIASYNVGCYLEKTIKSLIVDNLLDKLEIIIINDGSSDNTLSIAKAYEMKYPDSIVVINKNNGGYGSTINVAIELSSAKYFKQLDGDDWFVKKNLNDFICFLEATNADLVITPYFKYFEKLKRKELVNNHSYLNNLETLINNVNFKENVTMHELTIKTKLLKDNNIKISENCFYTDNEYTFLPMIKANTICKLNRAIYVYRLGRDGQSVSLIGVHKHFRDTKVVASRLIAEYNANNIHNNISIIQIKLNYIIDAVYTYFLCSGDNQAKNELIEFDKMLKQKYRNIYDLSMDTPLYKFFKK